MEGVLFRLYVGGMFIIKVEVFYFYSGFGSFGGGMRGRSEMEVVD